MQKKWIAGGLAAILCAGIGFCRIHNTQDQTAWNFRENIGNQADEEWQESFDIQENSQTAETLPTPTPLFYMVHVCGAVQNPGVYQLPEGSRIFEAIEAAGGFMEGADEEYLNQAESLQDGRKLYVPTREEVQNEDVKLRQSAEMPAQGLVNINTASEELLCTLPGIGTSKAKSIIAYREEHGAYGSIEEIMNVTGIKEGMFEKIRDSITI